jgi:G3E family GTPase
MFVVENQNSLVPIIADTQPVPVLVLSGTLGSGKTTVINAMLDQEIIPPYYNVLLLENDIGRANQDFARVNLPDTRKIPLTSGCICCRSLGQLSAELKRIEGLPEGSRPDLILIETTGIAHPDVIKTELRQMGIPSVVAVTVDVAHFEDNVRLNLVDRGLASADKLILTWWDGIVSPDALNDPRLDSIRRYIGERELEAIALGAKREPAQQVFFKPERQLNGVSVEAAFYGAEKQALLLPSVDDLEPRAAMDFSGTHAAIKARTVYFRDAVKVADLLDALAPFREVGGTILRIKATQFDMVHNEISLESTALTLDGPVNIITSPAFDLNLISHLTVEGETETLETAESRALQAAITRLVYMTERHPRNPVHADYIQMEFHENEGYDYADRLGVPTELRDAFYAVAIEARINALNAIVSEAWQDHSELAYYKSRLGSQCLWLIEHRRDDLAKHGVLQHLLDARLAVMHFEGLTSIVLPNHIDEIKEASLAGMRDKFESLVGEIGDRDTAVDVAQAAYENCRKLDPTGSWERYWSDIQAILARS